MIYFEKSQNFVLQIDWSNWLFEKLELKCTCIYIFFLVAGIPLSASILTTGIVCTFYTSLVSMAKKSSHRRAKHVHPHVLVGFCGLGRVKPTNYSDERNEKIYRSNRFPFQCLLWSEVNHDLNRINHWEVACYQRVCFAIISYVSGNAVGIFPRSSS